MKTLKDCKEKMKALYSFSRPVELKEFLHKNNVAFNWLYSKTIFDSMVSAAWAKQELARLNLHYAIVNGENEINCAIDLDNFQEAYRLTKAGVIKNMDELESFKAKFDFERIKEVYKYESGVVAKFYI